MADDAVAAGGAKAPKASDALGRSLTTAATVIGLFVTANTLLSSCSKDRIELAQDYRRAVEAEEKFWSGLYSQYLQAVTDRDPNLENRRTRLLAIAMLALHKNPDFAEFRSWYQLRSGEDPGTIALNRMRQVLHDALRDPRSSSEEISQEIGFFLDEKAGLRERASRDGDEEGPPEVTENAQAATEVAEQAQSPRAPVLEGGEAIRPVAGSRILASGSPKGWDVDVFWCMGGQEQATFNRALKVGNALAVAAGGQDRIGDGVTLGRIRLRSLPAKLQNSGSFYTAGDGVVADGGAGETAAAQAIARHVRDKAGVALRQVRSVGVSTNWYLSVFVCSGRAASPPPAPAADAAAPASRDAPAAEVPGY